MPANLRAAMRADVEEAADLAVAVAQEDDGAARDLARDELIGLGDLGVVPDIEPALGKDALKLGVENRRIGVVRARDAEAAAPGVGTDRAAEVRH